MLELSETSRILKEADSKSLVILDELGRGTSTYDGYSIAYATLHHLTNFNLARGLFSTHYHMLGQEMEHYPLIKQQHMACLLSDSNESRDEEDVIFLYQITDGSCPKSYGMNVAKMAGLSSVVIDRAKTIATQFEKLNILQSVSDQNLEYGQLPTAHQHDLLWLNSGSIKNSLIETVVRQTIKCFENKQQGVF